MQRESPVPRDLDQALAEISAIRSQIARTIVFRGFGPATVAVTAALAVAAAVAQTTFLPAPGTDVVRYVALWGATAIVCGALVGVEMVARARRVHLTLANEMLWTAIEQFLPAAVAGGLLTVVLVGYVPEATWMLPGLWQITFSLGVFASCRFLPPPMFLVGAWYLTAGLATIVLARGTHAFSPVAMGSGFGVGQLLTAVILQVYREEEDAEV
jgi:hypothetical protein